PTPSSTLFPYTTLFRSLPQIRTTGFAGRSSAKQKSSDSGAPYLYFVHQNVRKLRRSALFSLCCFAVPMPIVSGKPPGAVHKRLRSEEHTSELQSRSDLV